MSRAAFLPTPGDPILLTLWFKYYKRWLDEIDRLYIHLNSASPKPVIDYIRDLAANNPKTYLIYYPHQIEHGAALRQMTQLATEEYIMFVEDDGFIFKPGIVDKCFKLIESGEADIIGSKRGSCSQWIYDTASTLYEIDNSGIGDNGPNFWPNFFFCRREDLLKTSLHFEAKHWKKGEMVVPLKQSAPEDLYADTFVYGSLELRALGLKVAYEPQYHGNTDDMPDYIDKKNIWDGNCSWLHVGSLSSGYHGMLKPDHKIDNEHFSTEAEKLELERRITFYQLAYDSVVLNDQTKPILREYQDGIMRLVNAYGLNTSRIAKRMEIYKEVMG